MTLPRSHAYLGGPPHVPLAAPPDAPHKTGGRPAAGLPAGPAPDPLAPDSGRVADSGRAPDPGRAAEPGPAAEPGRANPDRVWEQRRALGRRLASLRSRSGFSQWEFAPLTGYSRSTLSDAELGRHRLRREFWERCDDALMTGGVLTAAYEHIEAAATAVRRSVRSQAQAAREEQATRRLQALLPVPGAAAPDAGGAAAGPDSAGQMLADGISWSAAGAIAVGPAPVARVEECPHCHQPVTVIIVATAPPPAGGSAP